MADHHSGDEVEPEVASHLAESMDEVPGPEPVHHLPPPASEGHSWPDGSGKHRHPKDRDEVHGRQSQEVAEAAEHRMSRPDIRHRDK